MVAGTGHSAAFVYHSYQDEVTFNVKPANLNRVFGLQPKFTDVTPKQNLGQLSALNQNTIANYWWGRFDGTVRCAFEMSNMWWLSLLWGAPANTGGGPYTHTYPSSGTAPPLNTTTFSLELGDNNTTGATAVTRDFSACLLDQITLTARINESVHCDAQILLGSETDGSTIASAPSDSENSPMAFVQAKIQAPDGTTLTEVQEFELTMNQNGNYNYGMFASAPQSAWRALTAITGKFTATMKDNTWLSNLSGRAQLATATFIFDNGLGGTSQKQLTIKMKNVGLDSHSTFYNPNERIDETIPLVMQGLNSGITWIDNTSVPP